MTSTLNFQTETGALFGTDGSEFGNISPDDPPHIQLFALKQDIFGVSGAQPLALFFLSASFLLLLQAIVPSFLRGRVVLTPSLAESNALSDEQHGQQKTPPVARLDLSQCETEEERKLAEAALGRVAVSSDQLQLGSSNNNVGGSGAGGKDVVQAYLSRSRTRIGMLAFMAAAQLAIAAGMLAWILTAHAGKEGREYRQRWAWQSQLLEAALKAAAYLSVLALLMRRHSISAHTFAAALTAASLLDFGSQALELLVPEGFAIFPAEPASSLTTVLVAAVHSIGSMAAPRMGKVAPLFIKGFTSAHAGTPSGHNIRFSVAQEEAVGILVIRLLTLVLSMASTFIAGTLPLGPPRVYQPTPTSAPAPMLGVGALGGESYLSRLSFSYCTPYILFAHRNGGLNAEDLPYLHTELRAITLFQQMREAWRHYRGIPEGKTLAPPSQAKKGKPSTLLFATIRALRSEIVQLYSLSWISAILFYAPAFCINRFVSVFEREEAAGGKEPRDIRAGIVWAVAIATVSVSQTFMMGYLLTLSWSSMRCMVKQQLTTLLFAKTLRRQELSTGVPKKHEKKDKANGATSAILSKDTDEEQDDEEDDDNFLSKASVMTLIGNDVERCVQFSMQLFTLALTPIEAIVGFTYIWTLLGWGALVGLLASLSLVPVIHFISKLDSKFQDTLMKARDKRVTFLNEAIEAIRMIKFSAWETKIMDRIMLSRRKELREMRKAFYCEIANEASVSFSPLFVIIVAFAWTILVDGRPLTPAKAFTSVAVLNELRFALTELPALIQALIELWVSLRRMQKYLDLPEVEPPLPADPASLHSGPKPIHIEQATISWPLLEVEQKADAGSSAPIAENAPAFKLQDITLSFEPGKINLIVGRVAAGKSMLLLALLGELNVDEGSITCPRSHPEALGGPLSTGFISPADWIRSDLVAYVPQTAWLVNASLRDNILWGLPMDETRYQETLRTCALLPDIAILEDGDLTDIGEQGIGLSGGQKTRVSLARAVYSRASLLLMDSPLSNVDAHTANHIHEQLLQGELLQGRTTLLVTHQVAMLASSAARIVLLEDGRSTFQGTSEEFMNSDKYSGLLEDLKDDEVEEEGNAEPVPSEEAPSTLASGTNSPAAGQSTATTPAASRAPSIKDESEDENDKKNEPIEIKPPRKIMSEEERQRGAVRWSTYQAYIEACGGWKLFGPVLAAFAIDCSWGLVTNLWLRGLSADAGRQHPTHTPLYWMTGYAGLLSFSTVLKAAAFLMLYMITLRASENLFKDMLSSVFRAKLRTHDTIPKGRFLNRFSTDMEGNDQLLPMFFASMVNAFGEFVVSLIAVVIGGGGNFLYILILLTPIYLRIASLYRAVTRDLRRLEAASKSPLTSSFSDLLSGAIVVRAYGSSGRMMANVLAKSDEAVRFMWLLAQASRWTNFFIQICSATLVLAGNLSILFNLKVDSATAGFASSFLTTSDFLLMWALICFSNFEQKAVSTERIVEYQNLPQEPPAFIAPGPPASWPEIGKVEVRDLEMKYAPELPTILKGISLQVPGGAKVGVLGRTGSGKSSLAASFFRFVEPTRGEIRIDGLDITKIGIEELRSRLTIVPQDPVILSGTLREALDPFHDYSDERILAVLKQSHLLPADPEQAKSSHFSNLAYPISEGGQNLSAGQRQLVCLARALLRESRVVFFDEASSALDSETDASIGATIRKAFGNSTIFMIAHRLRTIADFDYVLVLEKGEVLEFDKPIRLLDNSSSSFYKLCKASGRSEFKHLREMALKSAASF